jgi:hypothetical protein
LAVTAASASAKGLETRNVDALLAVVAMHVKADGGYSVGAKIHGRCHVVTGMGHAAMDGEDHRLGTLVLPDVDGALDAIGTGQLGQFVFRETHAG